MADWGERENYGLANYVWLAIAFAVAVIIYVAFFKCRREGFREADSAHTRAGVHDLDNCEPCGCLRDMKSGTELPQYSHACN